MVKMQIVYGMRLAITSFRTGKTGLAYYLYIKQLGRICFYFGKIIRQILPMPFKESAIFLASL